jgi:hypothetical protein
VFSCSSFFKQYNCWWKRQIDITTNTWTLVEGYFPLPDMTVEKKCLFLAIIVQLVNDQRDTKGCWSTLEKYLVAFYRNTMKQARFYHIHKFLHFSDKKNEPDKTDDNDDGLWKMRAVFYKFNDSYAKCYSLTVH